MESAKEDAVSKEHVSEHIARVKTPMVRYYIKDSRYVFNMD